MMFAYALGILGGIAGIALLDRRFKLAFWHDAQRTWLTIGVAMAVFIIWDFLGIGLGIFRHGASPFMLPFTILPEFPIEELLFLFLLSYNTLTLYRGVQLWLSRTSR